MPEGHIVDPPGNERAVGSAGIDADIPAVLASLALLQPDIPAIQAPGRTPLSFADLHARMTYLQATLGAWGIGRGDTVAVLLPKGPEMAAACAILPAAATCLPLDPRSSVEDCERLFRRCAVRGLIAPRGLASAATTAADRLGLMHIALFTEPTAPAGTFELTLQRRATGMPGESPCGPDVAYVLCTSGTTARKKLVPIGHRKITGYSALASEFYGYVPTDTGLHIVPHHLSHGIKAALMVPLLAGTSIVCPPSLDVASFFDCLATYRPTWFTCGFTMHLEILRNMDRYGHLPAETKLRFVRAGSGKLEEHEIAALEKAYNAPVVVKLSSTETCLISATPAAPGQRHPGSVGKAVLNEVAIRGDDGTLLHPGSEGEIVVRGPLVFEGYIDDAELTRRSFVDGWFRTGDLGRFDEDGNLFVTGRIKEMINRGGEKIAPAEIDLALESHPAVAEAAAFGIPHPTLGELVVAAVVPRAGRRFDEKEVRQHVRDRLGGSKVPNKIFVLDRLPRTESGKLLRTSLPNAVSALSAQA